MSDLQLWAVSTAIVVLLGMVGYFWKRSKNLEDSAIVATVKSVHKSVDKLSTSIDKLSERSDLAFKEGEHRMDEQDREIERIKTRCGIFHGITGEP